MTVNITQIKKNALSNFSSATVSRAHGYRHIAKENISVALIAPKEVEVIELSAHIQGTRRYSTQVYFTQEGELEDTECSCPVGYYCKHTAALVMAAYETGLLAELFSHLLSHSLRDETQQAPQGDTLANKLQHRQQTIEQANKAQAWLDSFNRQLSQVTTNSKEQKQQQSAEFFVLFQESLDNEYTFTLQKRNASTKKNSVKSKHWHTTEVNLLNGIDIRWRADFIQLLPLYQNYWGIACYLLQAEQIKKLCQYDCVHVRHNKKDKLLHWSDDVYQLTLDWQENDDGSLELQQKWQEKPLLAQVSNSDFALYTLENSTHMRVLNCKPPLYIDTKNKTIGLLTCDYDHAMLTQLLNAPRIPESHITSFEKTVINYSEKRHKHSKKTAALSSQTAAKGIPIPRIMDIEEYHGKPVPTLVFDGKEQQVFFHENQAMLAVAVRYDYPHGQVWANQDDKSFVVKENGKRIRQHRNIGMEKRRVTTLKKHYPDIDWKSELYTWRYGYYNSKQANQEKHLLTAPVTTWLALDQLAQTDPKQYKKLGWQIEHAQPSSLVVSHATKPELQLLENGATNTSDSDADTGEIEWFSLGMKVSTDTGMTYDLIALLAEMVNKQPDLLDQDYVAQLSEQEHIPLVTPDGQVVYFQTADIQPILQSLQQLMSYAGEGKHFDRYDALGMIELTHVLGMPWQGNERLKNLHERIKQGFADKLPTPEGFVGELRSYQQQGLAWLQFLRETEHAGILADDMGLGKTAQTLAHIMLEKQAGRMQQPALIVAPTSLMYNWRNEAHKFTPALKVLIFQGAKRHELVEELADADIILTTYPLLSRDESVLLSHDYYFLILDEAQHIKNPQTKMAQVARKIKTAHRLCLTGTPMENHLGELWSLYHFLMPGFLGNDATFKKTYRTPIEKYGDNHLRKRLANRIKPFMLRRLKQEVATDLPPKSTIEVKISMNKDQQALYESVRLGMQTKIQGHIAKKGFKRSQIEILDALLKLRQVCCHPSLLNLDAIKDATPQPTGNAKSSAKSNVKSSANKKPAKNLASAKLDTLMEMLVEMVAEGRRILIFSQFTKMLDMIAKALNKEKIDHVKLTGRTRKREEVIAAFQEGDVPVFLISLKAGGTGLNLTAADVVIHYDPWWNPAAEEQASDRAWRIGQDKPVFVYKLITNNSIEEKILTLQQRKHKLTQGVLSHDSEETVKFSEADLLDLLTG